MKAGFEMILRSINAQLVHLPDRSVTNMTMSRFCSLARSVSVSRSSVDCTGMASEPWIFPADNAPIPRQSARHVQPFRVKAILCFASCNKLKAKDTAPHGQWVFIRGADAV